MRHSHGLRAATVKGNTAEPGQALYTTAGTFSWTCPSGVRNISVLCVGGGGSGGVSNGDGNAGGQSRFETIVIAGGGGAGLRSTSERISPEYPNGGVVIAGEGFNGRGGAVPKNAFWAGGGGGAIWLDGGSYSGAQRSWHGEGGRGMSSTSTGGGAFGGAGSSSSTTSSTGAGGLFGAGGAGGRDGYGGGAGATAWLNDIIVIPENSYTVVVGVGAVRATGSSNRVSSPGARGLVRIMWGNSSNPRAYPTTNVF
jgi:hypothetical protein